MVAPGGLAVRDLMPPRDDPGAADALELVDHLHRRGVGGGVAVDEHAAAGAVAGAVAVGGRGDHEVRRPRARRVFHPRHVRLVDPLRRRRLQLGRRAHDVARRAVGARRRDELARRHGDEVDPRHPRARRREARHQVLRRRRGVEAHRRARGAVAVLVADEELVLGGGHVLEDDLRRQAVGVAHARAEGARRVGVGAAVAGAAVAVAGAVGDVDRAGELVRAAAVGADGADHEGVVGRRQRRLPVEERDGGGRRARLGEVAVAVGGRDGERDLVGAGGARARTRSSGRCRSRCRARPASSSRSRRR